MLYWHIWSVQELLHKCRVAPLLPRCCFTVPSNHKSQGSRGVTTVCLVYTHMNLGLWTTKTNLKKNVLTFWSEFSTTCAKKKKKMFVNLQKVDRLLIFLEKREARLSTVHLWAVTPTRYNAQFSCSFWLFFTHLIVLSNFRWKTFCWTFSWIRLCTHHCYGVNTDLRTSYLNWTSIHFDCSGFSIDLFINVSVSLMCQLETTRPEPSYITHANSHPVHSAHRDVYVILDLEI